MRKVTKDRTPAEKLKRSEKGRLRNANSLLGTHLLFRNSYISNPFFKTVFSSRFFGSLLGADVFEVGVRR